MTSTIRHRPGELLRRHLIAMIATTEMQEAEPSLPVDAPPRRDNHQPPLEPFLQGHLDGLCGVYALVNALQLAVGSDSRLKRHHWHELFQKLLHKVDRTIGAASAITGGIGPKPLWKLAKAATFHLADHHGIELFASRPLRHEGELRTPDLVQWLKTLVGTPGSALVVALYDHLNHWSVVRSVGHHFITLFDSGRCRRVRIDRCAVDWTGPRGDGVRHVIDPDSIVLIKPVTVSPVRPDG